MHGSCNWYFRDAKDELEHRKNHNEAVERVEKETERFKYV